MTEIVNLMRKTEPIQSEETGKKYWKKKIKQSNIGGIVVSEGE